MLKIKLARFGKKKQPIYRIVVNEARDKRDGKYVAAIGLYSPTESPKLLTIDVAAYQEWLTKGAQPTDTVASLYQRFQSGTPFPAKTAQLSKKAKAKAATEKEAAAEAAEAAKASEATTEAEPADETAATSDAEATASAESATPDTDTPTATA